MLWSELWSFSKHQLPTPKPVEVFQTDARETKNCPLCGFLVGQAVLAPLAHGDVKVEGSCICFYQSNCRHELTMSGPYSQRWLGIHTMQKE